MERLGPQRCFWYCKIREGAGGKKQKGFSLIELLIVVAIILIIAGIAIPNLLVPLRPISAYKTDRIALGNQLLALSNRTRFLMQD